MRSGSQEEKTRFAIWTILPN
ncbi:hypothetical protein FAIPA1_30296 [Frankia sp. AiPs1]